MGQALRRVSGRVQPSAASSPAAKPPPQPKRTSEAPPVSGAGGATASQDRPYIPNSVSAEDSHDKVLEERDPSYDKMLSFMVGRIATKPGGRAEMGDASIKERYDRPLPTLRSSKANGGGRGAQQHLTPGTLTIEHIQQIILLHQGKSDGHQGPMATTEIAERFQVDATVIEKIVQSISLPEEDTNNKSKE